MNTIIILLFCLSFNYVLYIHIWQNITYHMEILKLAFTVSLQINVLWKQQYKQ